MKQKENFTVKTVDSDVISDCRYLKILFNKILFKTNVSNTYLFIYLYDSVLLISVNYRTVIISCWSYYLYIFCCIFVYSENYYKFLNEALSKAARTEFEV